MIQRAESDLMAHVHAHALIFFFLLIFHSAIYAFRVNMIKHHLKCY